MKYVLILLGIISLALGVIGIFLPVLPTTPFLLLSATLFLRSSQKLYDWLLSHPCFGEYIRNFKSSICVQQWIDTRPVLLIQKTRVFMLYKKYGAGYSRENGTLRADSLTEKGGR